MESFCIIGLGKFGQSLALSLAEEGKQVVEVNGERYLLEPALRE